MPRRKSIFLKKATSNRGFARRRPSAMTPCKGKLRATWFQTPSPTALRPSGSSGSARVWSPATDGSVVVTPSTPGPISEPPVSGGLRPNHTTDVTSRSQPGSACSFLSRPQASPSQRVRLARSLQPPISRQSVFTARGAAAGPCFGVGQFLAAPIIPNSLGSGAGVARDPTRLIPARPGRVVVSRPAALVRVVRERVNKRPFQRSGGSSHVGHSHGGPSVTISRVPAGTRRPARRSRPALEANASPVPGNEPRAAQSQKGRRGVPRERAAVRAERPAVESPFPGDSCRRGPDDPGRPGRQCGCRGWLALPDPVRVHLQYDRDVGGGWSRGNLYGELWGGRASHRSAHRAPAADRHRPGLCHAEWRGRYHRGWLERQYRAHNQPPANRDSQGLRS